MRRREYDRSIVTDTVENGVWVNYGDGTHFTLIIPRTGQPLKNPDQTPWVVSLDEVMAAGKAASLPAGGDPALHGQLTLGP